MWRSQGDAKRGAAFLLLIAAWALSGCARTVTVSTVRPDGSWTRKVVFHISAPDDAGDKDKKGKKSKKRSKNKGDDLSSISKIEDVFAPPSGAGWTITKSKANGDLIMTATRHVAAGEPVKDDLTIKESKKHPAPIIANEAVVRQVAPGRWEYRETLHWRGNMKNRSLSSVVDSPQIHRIIKDALPPGLATDADIHELTVDMVKDILLYLIGPQEPKMMEFFSEAVMFPELAERHLHKHLTETALRTLQAKFGDKLTAEQRAEIMRKVIRKFLASSKNSKSDAGLGGLPSADAMQSLVAMTFILQLPGKILSTNGEKDELTNEVYWALYPEAASAGDITLTAIWEPERKAQARSATVAKASP